ncbi:hypothetical protein DICPUDRAFT_152520 [Dictyostelium purpureum]|uniref:Peptidase A1 domain-containing protein n=1 Tax=Dictyostelium purpureum TaxID=5786 RepID=F0ZLK6_DICPU|nr:uncharacterized protein DICPUDRAFT_152520 [Dictyostelium purpureum]EGC35170.1 hypothetical protein DICPUDRAFT_152520 [Dictyostelium purpureum]|eukprot:XP_003288308.1 hypothetical protein DICPUDRAFT_152520 [Dictyostelium purpureum]
MKGDIVQILTSINVGGVSQEVIVDTGSVLLVVPSTLCNSCQQPLPHYHPSSKIEYMGCDSGECKEMGNSCIEFKSNGIKVCGNQVRYLQNTEIITILVQDTFSFTNDTGDVLATFGSIVSNKGRSLEHGIIGLGKTCDGCRKSPIETIFEKTNISRIFSMWLDANYQGTLLLGDIDPQFSNSITYTPMLTIEESHYGVLLSNAGIYDKITETKMILTSKDFGEVIIDSGTSEALIDTRAYYKIKNFLQKDCKPGLCGQNSLLEGYCYNYPTNYFNIFPTIHIEMLGGATMEVEPKSYITSSYINGIRYRCFGIKPSPLKGKSIIGLSWLRDNYIVFDTEHNRMGFAKKLVDQFNSSSDSFDFSEFTREQQNNNDGDDDEDDIEFSSSYEGGDDSKELKPRFNDKKYVVKISDNDLLVEELQSQLDDYNRMLINDNLSMKQAKQILNSRKKIIKKLSELKSNQENNEEEIQQQKETYQYEEQLDQISNNNHIINNNINNNNKNSNNKHKRLEFQEPKQRKLREWFNKKEGKIYSTIYKPKYSNELLEDKKNNNYNNIDNNKQNQCLVLDNEKIFNNGNKTSELLSKRPNQNDTRSHPIVLKYDPETKRKSNIPVNYSNVGLKSNKKNLKYKLPRNIVPYYKNTNNTLLSRVTKKSNEGYSIQSENVCIFDFIQKKEFEWIDNNGKSYILWESTIVNHSQTSINKFILSTMDNVQYTIGMTRSVLDQTTTIISLPSNQTIPPNSSYRWIYTSNLKNSLSFSVECGLQ